MKPAIEVIIDTFGGLRPFARAIGKTASTVQYWKEASFLPRTERDAVIAALTKVGMNGKRAERTVDRAILGASSAANGEAAHA